MLAVFAQCGHLDHSSKGGISCILWLLCTCSYKRKSNCILRKVLHTLRSPSTQAREVEAGSDPWIISGHVVYPGQGKGYCPCHQYTYQQIHTHHCETYKCTTCGRDAMWCNVHTWDTHLHLGNAGYVAGKHENILSDKFSRRSRIGNLTREILSRPAQLIALFRKKVLPTFPWFLLDLEIYLFLIWYTFDA